MRLPNSNSIILLGCFTLLVLFIGCILRGYDGYETCNYINAADYDLLIEAYYSYHNDSIAIETTLIRRNDTFVFKSPYTTSKDEKIDAFEHFSGYWGGDSLKLTLGDFEPRVLVNSDAVCQEKNSPYCEDNYQWERLGDRSFKYTFTFKEEDFQ